MTKTKIYLAGPLFTDSEMNERTKEAKILRELGFEVYSPLEQNGEIGYEPDELFKRDIAAMTNADISVTCLDNYDSGTMAELGWFTAKNKPVFSYWSNWKYNEPDNLFIRGLAIQKPNKLFKSFTSLSEFLKQYNQKFKQEKS
jgi:nucleoside 2-deoxyribosyltransferase